MKVLRNARSSTGAFSTSVSVVHIHDDVRKAFVRAVGSFPSRFLFCDSEPQPVGFGILVMMFSSDATSPPAWTDD